MTEAISIRFKETPAYSFYDYHPAPVTQYVVTLSGTLLFETFLGDTFIFEPGDVLIAMDTTGSGHKWKMIDDQPWRRAYVAFKEDAIINFTEEIKSKQP